MIPDAFMLHGQYADLKMPVVIIAGEQDKLIDIDTQSARLHSDVSQSSFHRIAGTRPHDSSDRDRPCDVRDNRSGERIKGASDDRIVQFT